MCVCVCVCARARARARARVHMCTKAFMDDIYPRVVKHVEKRDQHYDVFISHSPTYFLRQSHSLNLELTNLATLASESWRNLSPFLQVSGCRYIPLPLALYVVVGDPISNPYALPADILLTETSLDPHYQSIKSKFLSTAFDTYLGIFLTQI